MSDLYINDPVALRTKRRAYRIEIENTMGSSDTHARAIWAIVTPLVAAFASNLATRARFCSNASPEKRG